MAESHKAVYKAVVSRDGAWWMISIPDLNGVTQARSRDEVETMARDYIALTIDAPADSVSVDIEWPAETTGMDPTTFERLVEESDQLRERIRKLSDFMVSGAFRALDRAEEADLLEQLQHMHFYHLVLGRRIDRNRAWVKTR
jgi:predicted RNase H-like HicB family nuclease